MLKTVFAVILLFAIFAIISAEYQNEEFARKLQNAVEKCKTEKNISNEDLRKFNAEKLPEDKESYCFLACVFKSLEFMDNDNKIDKGNIITTMETYLKDIPTKEFADQVRNGVNKCLDESQDNGDECEVVKKTAKCVFNEGKKLHLF